MARAIAIAVTLGSLAVASVRIGTSPDVHSQQQGPEEAA